MENFVTLREHNEFSKRIEEHDKRQDARIELLEKNVENLKVLNASIEKLAINMENMVNEQKNQGERLESLEDRDGEMYRKIVGYIATTIVGIVIGFPRNPESVVHPLDGRPFHGPSPCQAWAYAHAFQALQG